VISPDPPVEQWVDATTVLDGKGTLRRAKNRRALAGCAPLWRSGIHDGRLRRDHEVGRATSACRPTGPRNGTN